ncbi:MAG: polysaccharide biosynthesis tyrosine autokinase [Candidatus Aminicenantes bacterium]|nr:polysaccharide biosynthesis tyrosine autokinase [Candidatus Aminicenantes bacterium]NIM84313.1 polysaccharide biosynthesis tyrosine autokinase [Candidatus Aminicenantes bacterium]NIN23799.1 polysaccharide biosynthesis tyrosine autokinase [Candidatus Aminicenantes bacterium]NIN47515.1 polysaccharide biosynthesis tyrosine autokinase [Candidatus Aminicenantes bacterium]NIN90435.1 polysaccharide biosynthesis tyrosine autokinase [Candidatus Aminicenantes bacterium]
MDNYTNSDDILGKDEKFQIEKYWRIIKPRLHILVIICLFVTAAAYIKVSTITPIYKATGLLMIEPENRNTITFDNQVFYGFRGEYFNTQIRILQSRSLGKDVREEFYAASRDKDIVIQGPFVEPVEDTHLVEISYRSTHPGAAAELVNLLFVKFIEFKLDLKSQSSKLAAEYINRQIKKLQESLARKEKEMHEYSNRKELFYVSKEDSTVVKKFSDLNQAYTEAQIERINKESLYQELKGMSYESFPQVSKSQLIDSLKNTYSGLESDYKRKSQIFKPSYPEMVRLKSQMETLQERIQTETRDIARKALQKAKSEYQSAKKKEDSLRELLANQKEVLLSTNADAIYYRSLNIEVQNMRSLLNYLVRKQKESVVSSRLEGIQTSNIKIIDEAEEPKTPVNAGKQKTLILAALLGLALGFGVIFLLDYLDQTIKTPEEVQMLLGLPALGIIPSTTAKAVKSYDSYYYRYTYGNPGNKKNPEENKKKNASKPRDIELINFLEPDSWFVEKYRAIRTSIMLSTPGESPRIISISSALPSEGKTVTTLNLAVSFSQLGKKVLVIDGDLRRPKLHKIFKIKNDKGLSSYLAGRANSLVVLKTHIPKLFLVPSGPLPPHPAELIDSEMMAAFLEKLLEKMDFIFIDTPPLLGFKDAVVLGRHAHGMILVTWTAKTHRNALEKAKQELDQFNIRTLGVVLNRAVEKRHIYGYNYNYYNYSYK